MQGLPLIPLFTPHIRFSLSAQYGCIQLCNMSRQGSLLPHCSDFILLHLTIQTPHQSLQRLVCALLVIILSTFSHFSLYLNVSTAPAFLMFFKQSKPILASGPLHLLIPIPDCSPSDLCILIIQITRQNAKSSKTFPYPPHLKQRHLFPSPVHSLSHDPMIFCFAVTLYDLKCFNYLNSFPSSFTKM